MKLTKNLQNKMLFGVCSGIADYTGLDVSLLRIGFILGSIFTGSVLFWFYLLFALVLPKNDS